MKKIFLLIILIAVFTFELFAKDPDLVRRIESVLAKLPASTNVGIMVYDPLLRDTMFVRKHKQSMIPASNTKLFTSAVALDLLGGDFELRTTIYANENSFNGEVINGNLYIKGYGNSLFRESDLNNMVEYIHQIGVKHIKGGIIGDDSYFDDIYTRDDWILDENATVKLPPVSALVIDRNRRQTRSGRRSYTVHIDNPAQYIAQQLRNKLLEKGIKVDSPASKGITPSNVFEIVSSKTPLTRVLNLVNKSSDNYVAECLFKTIGAEASKHQGTAFYATQAVLNFIDENGIFFTGTTVVDGSGISRFNVATIGSIIGVLERMYFDLNNFEDYYNSMSIAGVDGTLRTRMNNTIGENNVRGKTGTLRGVSALSGYVTTAAGDDLIFAMIFEFTRGSADLHRNIQDEICLLLAGYHLPIGG